MKIVNGFFTAMGYTKRLVDESLRMDTIEEKERTTMLTIQQIADCVADASREYPQRRAELFRSYANGSSTLRSDVDLQEPFPVY